MPNSKGTRRGQGQDQEKSRRGRLTEKASLFHERIPVQTLSTAAEGNIPLGFSSPEGRPKLTKLLLNVTIQRSLGAVQVVMSQENIVGDLIAAAVTQYAKAGRRPILPSTDPSRFDLHYSQFSLECLGRKEKLTALGSRNFFLCPKRTGTDGGRSTTSCSKEAEEVSKSGIPCLNLIGFLLCVGIA